MQGMNQMPSKKINVTQIVSETFAVNTYVVRQEDSNDCLVIDPGFEPEQIIDFLEKHRLTPHAILVTHGHMDHIAGINAIKEKYTVCNVYASKIDAFKFTNPNGNLSALYGFPVVLHEPDFLLNDGDRLNIVDIEIQAILVPGHSAGHLIFSMHQGEGLILFVGDVIFMDSIGRSDFSDGNETLLLEGIRDKILTLPDTTVLYPGHGSQTTVGRERRYNPFLKNDIC